MDNINSHINVNSKWNIIWLAKKTIKYYNTIKFFMKKYHDCIYLQTFKQELLWTKSNFVKYNKTFHKIRKFCCATQFLFFSTRLVAEKDKH